MRLVFTLFAILLFRLLNVRSSTYCAQFSNTSAAGARGYFQLTILNGTASYEFWLDLTDYTTTCDISQGLTYHIHSYWLNDSVTSSANAFCGSSYTGGHFDPNLACGPSSEEASGICPMISRTSQYNYSYSCSPNIFQRGDYGACEVGDISGKFGYVTGNDDNTNIFQSTHTYIDYLPPYEINYNNILGIIKPWTSIVFHCRYNNARLFCGKFISMTSSCSPPALKLESASKAWRFTDWGVYSQLIVSCIVVTCVFIAGMMMFLRYTGERSNRYFEADRSLGIETE